MNTLPEPDELMEAECNAHGLYGLPEPLPSAQAPAELPGQPRQACGRAIGDPPRSGRLGPEA